MSLSLILATVLLSPPDRQDDLTAEEKKTFALIDRFDSLDTSKLPFVRAATGSWIKYDDDPPMNRYRYGFLLSDGEKEFTARYLSLIKVTLTKTPAGKPEHERVGTNAVDMAAHARDYARRVAAGGGEPYKLDYYMRPDATMTPRAEALLLARALQRRGLTAEVHALWKASEPRSDADYELGKGFAYGLTLDFTDPALTRETILANHRKWLDAYPGHYFHKFVKKKVEILERMVEEDRVGREKAPGGETAQEREVLDLIFALRDERRPVKYWWSDGHYVPAKAPEPEEGSRPSVRLAMLGTRAAPALVEAVGDETFTRTVWYSSRHGGGLRLITVGSFAERILEEVSGLRFYGRTEERKARWQNWWKGISEKGEEGMLAELAARGDHSSGEAAKRLLGRWPKRVPDVIAGARKARNRGVRKELVGIVAGQKGEKVTEFLLEELEKGPYVPARVDAALALLDRGRQEGLVHFKKEWRTAAAPKEKRQPGVPKAVADFDFSIAQGNARQAMARFLLASGDPEAVRIVGKDLLRFPSRVRYAILESLRYGELADFLKRAAPKKQAEIEKELEGILVLLLDDSHRHGGSFGVSAPGGSATLRDPTTADLAATTLFSWWPDRYSFDPRGPSRLRERRILGLKNRWRERNGLGPIKIPPFPDVRSKDPEIPKQIDRIVGAADGDRRKTEAARLEEKGLGALPWVEDRLKVLPKDHPARRDLEVLAGRLSLIVREAKFYPGSWKAPKGLRTSIARLQGRGLDSKSLIDLLCEAAKALPEETGNVTLEADRLGDGTGTSVRLEALPARGDRGVSVTARTLVTSGGRSLAGSYGNGVRDRYDDPSDFADTLEAIDKALAGSYGQTFEIRIELRIR